MESLAAFEDYLSHNELGLALDVLAGVAEESSAGGECWRVLHAPVAEMTLTEDDPIHGPTVRLVGRHCAPDA